MQEFNPLDEHVLGAFVDGQLDTAGRESVIEAMDRDPEVRERVYRLRRTKDLMRLGFGNARAPFGTRRSARNGRSKPYSVGIAASLVALAVALGAGTLGYHFGRHAEEASHPTLAATAQHQTDRVVLHIGESQPEQFATALAYTARFLEEHEERGGQIEVVAHAGGIDMMRSDVSPMKTQIVTMMSDHANVHFIACAQGIRALRKRGIEPKMIDKVKTDRTAFDHIVERLQSGWSYVKVDSLMRI